MLKNEFRSTRVKGLSFHPCRHWLLCGLYNGTILLFDYRLDVVVDFFTEHEGAVRAVDFHKTEPLFVSGGDDFVVKVWNYNLRRCLFSFYGHTDYIRSTFFHLKNPWIISASDDYSIRIWNWVSRTCLTTLLGHKHFVMCARFYNDPFVISCSLDKSIRVWNTGSLNTVVRENSMLPDLFGVDDTSVEFESQDHQKGVNWVDCELNENAGQSEPFTHRIVSGADDGRVILYAFNQSGFRLQPFSHSLSNHSHNVCSVLFHRGTIISCSEDQSIRIHQILGERPLRVRWDTIKTTNRYWCLASSSSRTLFAAGHDSGFAIYKVERERPLFALQGNKVCWRMNSLSSSNLHLKWTDVTTGETRELRLPLSANGCNIPNSDLKGLFVEGDQRIICSAPTGKFGCDYSLDADSAKLFPSNIRYVAPGAPGKLIILANDGLYVDPEKTRIETPFEPSVIFRSAPGTILCVVENKVLLYHLAQRTVIGELVVADVKYVEWDKKMQRVALIGKSTITLATRSLKLLTVITEVSGRVKSAVFDETFDVLYFSTSYHIKYCNLFNYEVSTICATRNAIYLIKTSANKIWYFSRYSTEVLMKELDNSELILKQKLQQRAYREVIQILSRGKLKGQALVGYLHQKNYSEVALQIEKDPLTRFYLALSCGEMEVAKETAEQLDDCNVWKMTAEAALAFGDMHLAKIASTRGGNHRYAAFLGLITGNISSVAPLVDATRDEHFQMQQALYMNDARQRIRIFADAGQLSLAYLTARSANLADLAEVISASMSPEVVERLSKVPCTPLPASAHAEGTAEGAVAPMEDNWPILRIESSIFSRMLKDPTLTSTIEVMPEVDLGDAVSEWGDEDGAMAGIGSAEKSMKDNGARGSLGGPKGVDESEEEGDPWDDEEGLGIDITATLSKAKILGQQRVYVAPEARPPISQQWTVSTDPMYLLLGGEVKSALEYLRKEIALCNPKPLIPVMKYLWYGVNLARPAWKVPSSVYVLTKCGTQVPCMDKIVPSFPNIPALLKEKLAQGFQLFVGAKFQSALNTFKSVLHYGVFVDPEGSPADVASIMESRKQAAQYARALSLQLQLKQEDPNSPRALALALYFTHFELFRPHMILALSQAMVKSFKLKHFRTAAAVGRRLLDLEPPKAKADQASAIIFEGETKEDRNDIDYDGRNPFEVCCVSSTPMYKGSTVPITCTYCGAPALAEYKMTLCPICELSALGVTKFRRWEDN